MGAAGKGGGQGLQQGRDQRWPKPMGRGWQCPCCPPALLGHRRAFPAGCKFIFLTTAITNSARMMEAMIEAKA